MSALKKTVLIVLLVALLPSQLAQGKFLGNLHYKGQDPPNFAQYWDQVTPENGGKWASCEQARDDWGYWSWLDRAYDFANANGFPFKEHCLVWGHSSGEPSWVCGLSASEQQAEVIEWFQNIGNRYNFDMLDVVNEPLHDPPCYKDAIGGDGSTGWDWVLWSFEKANQYVGGTRILNDYGLLNSSANASQIVEVAGIVNAQAVGAEAHGLERVAASVISSNLNTLKGAGLPVYVSEYDVEQRRDNVQLSIFQEQFPIFWTDADVAGVTLWGYVQGDIWKRGAYLLKSDGLTERPALTWLMEYVSGTTSTSTTTTSDTTSTTTTSTTTTTTAFEAPCSNPTPMVPTFTLTGIGTYCVSFEPPINFMTSRGLDELNVNGVDLTNKRTGSASMPPLIDGKWITKYVATSKVGYFCAQY